MTGAVPLPKALDNTLRLLRLIIPLLGPILGLSGT